ncbi:MAG: glycoside hydrolase 43 family protein [Gemmatimonadaceae bacterium]|nr:glycoside hydrolase 43 family protein [Chitinophagaceae bacterium]
MKKIILFVQVCLVVSVVYAQSSVSAVWSPDNGNGTYKNPVIHADYSDPDAIRVNDDFYMVSSSFNQAPGLPILHSRDLVNWTLIGHAIRKNVPSDHYSKVQHGNGVWAPAIRHHNQKFYIYYPDPDFGIYVITAKDIKGPWTEPILVEAGKGLIDPCPFWDDNGNAFLVHAYAGSRAGIKSLIVLKTMNTEGTAVTSVGKIVFDGHDADPTIEGPKMYKRNGYYYIMAPAGGVSTGWQLALRSRNIYGPYERKVVMDQGGSSVNGPHQGAWVNTSSGQDWFLHFQDRDAYGRIIHLQPVKWVNDWPVIGVDKDGDGKGEPVMTHAKPITKAITGGYQKSAVSNPADSDEFNDHSIGLQWQWEANPQPYWAVPGNGYLRMFSFQIPDSVKNYWDVPNLLMQKFPAEEFSATTKLVFRPRLDNEKTGLVVMGADYAYISVDKRKDGLYLSYIVCAGAEKGAAEKVVSSQKIETATFHFRVSVAKGAVCSFSYSTDGNSFTALGEQFVAKPGRWVGARIGIFCTRTQKTNDSGYADFDFFRFSKL